jgi:hypothetical protein
VETRQTRSEACRDAGIDLTAERIGDRGQIAVVEAKPGAVLKMLIIPSVSA